MWWVLPWCRRCYRGKWFLVLPSTATWLKQGNSPKGICLKSLLQQLLPTADLPLISKQWGFNHRCTRKVHIYGSPGSNSNSGTMHPNQISPNKPPACSTFMTKYTSSWGFTVFPGLSAPPRTSWLLPMQGFGVKCPQSALPRAARERWPHHWLPPGSCPPLVPRKHKSFVLKNTLAEITCWVSEVVSLWNSPDTSRLPELSWLIHQASASPLLCSNRITEPTLHIPSSFEGLLTQLRVYQMLLGINNFLTNRNIK